MRKTLAMLAAGALACGGSTINNTPTLPDPYEPNDTILAAKPIALGDRIVAASSSETDFDFYSFVVPPGGATVRFQTFDGSGGAACDPVNHLVDTYVELYDANGTRLAASDDSWVMPDGTRTFCEDFTHALPAGTQVVAVTGYPPYPFAYTLVVTIP